MIAFMYVLFVRIYLPLVRRKTGAVITRTVL